MEKETNGSDLQGFDYFAFISYCHQDEKWAKWLQDKLERYRLPTALCKEAESLPRDVKPIFRYPTDMSTGNLLKNVHKELDASKKLIVICSPLSAQSEWVNTEVQHFIDAERYDEIIPFIIEGEPNAGELECFPKALRVNKSKQLLGVNVAEYGRKDAFLLVVSGLLDVKYDQLKKRHEQRRRKKIIIYSFILVAAIMMVFGGLLLYQLYEAKNNINIIRNNAMKNLTVANNNAETLKEHLVYNDEFLTTDRKVRLISKAVGPIYSIVTQNTLMLDDLSYFESITDIIEETRLNSELVEAFYYKLGFLNQDYRYLYEDMESFRAHSNEDYYIKIKYRIEIILMRTIQLEHTIAIIFDEPSSEIKEAYISLGQEINDISSEFINKTKDIITSTNEEIEKKMSDLSPSVNDDIEIIVKKARTLKDLDSVEMALVAYDILYEKKEDEPWIDQYVKVAKILAKNPEYPGGCFIIEIVPDSAAQKIGLRQGDIIISYNSTVVTWPDDLTTAIKSSSLENNRLTVLRLEDEELLIDYFVFEGSSLGVWSVVV